jgi:GNAT superfamily N-acetyltransferase
MKERAGGLPRIDKREVSKMEFTIHPLNEAPEFRSEFDRLHQAGWPEFMLNDEKADLYWDLLMTVFAGFQIVLCGADKTVLAVGNSIPVSWDGTVEGLPSGWEGALERGALGYKNGIQPNTLSALAIVIDPDFQGKGISGNMIGAIKNTARENGFRHLIVPLRPSWKSRYPLIPIAEYLEWKNDDGFPFDPWLRTHLKAGGKVLTIAPQSMVITGTVADWERWTKMWFPQTGAYTVPGALTPVQIDCENNIGRYIDPNVWVDHELF